MRITTANTRLASCGVKCLNSNSVFQLVFSAWLTVLRYEIPHERQEREGKRQCYLTTVLTRHERT